MLPLGGVAVVWGGSRVHRLGLTLRVGGDVRVGGSTSVDIPRLTVALKRQNTQGAVSWGFKCTNSSNSLVETFW